MKLVELLVESWAKWMPADEAFVHQYDHGMVWSSDGQSWGQADPVEDFETARVTRPQWQAERDRIMAMDTQQAMASTEPTYEQQLWDRVAISAISGLCAGAEEDYSSVVHDAVFIADSFMAERAKRVGK